MLWRRTLFGLVWCASDTISDKLKWSITFFLVYISQSFILKLICFCQHYFQFAFCKGFLWNISVFFTLNTYKMSEQGIVTSRCWTGEGWYLIFILGRLLVRFLLTTILCFRRTSDWQSLIQTCCVLAAISWYLQLDCAPACVCVKLPCRVPHKAPQLFSSAVLNSSSASYPVRPCVIYCFSRLHLNDTKLAGHNAVQ